jgi:hypothetical protein
MDVVIALLVLIAGLVALVWFVTGYAERAKRRQAKLAATEQRAATWEVAEQGARSVFPGGGTVTKVFVRKVTADGAELDRVAVADVPSNATDWEGQMLEARSKAAQRAQILNGEP